MIGTMRLRNNNKLQVLASTFEIVEKSNPTTTWKDIQNENIGCPVAKWCAYAKRGSRC